MWYLVCLSCILLGLGPSLYASNKFSVLKHPDRIEIRYQGELVTDFYFATTAWPKPFLWPLRSPSGITVTRFYPLQSIEGEHQDHPWHRGIWFGHGAIHGIDFWREPASGDSSYPLPVGGFVLRSLDRVEAQPESVNVTATYDLVIGSGPSLGTVVETFVFQRAKGCNIVDATIQVAADQGTCLKFGDTEEGTFAMRLREEFREDAGAVILNDRGAKGSKAVWGKRAKWVDYSATIDGEAVGIAIFDHPQNYNHPTYWHARGYGLCAANPFGEHDFTGDPSRDGGLTLQAGQALTLKYRVVVHPGDAKAAPLTELYSEFSSR